MITFSRFTALFIGVLALAASSSRADSFDYTANIPGAGVSVTGSFEGTLLGNVITGVSNASVLVNGASLGAITVESLDGGSFVNGGAEISLDGTQNDFFFAADGFDGASEDSFYSLTDPAVDFNNPFFRYVDAGVNGSRSFWPPEFVAWSVTDTGPSSVPDGGETLAMLGIGIAATAFVRRNPSATRRRSRA